MDNNVAVMLIVALTSFQNVVADLKEGRVISLFTFSRKQMRTSENLSGDQKQYSQSTKLQTTGNFTSELVI